MSAESEKRYKLSAWRQRNVEAKASELRTATYQMIYAAVGRRHVVSAKTSFRRKRMAAKLGGGGENRRWGEGVMLAYQTAAVVNVLTIAYINVCCTA